MNIPSAQAAQTTFAQALAAKQALANAKEARKTAVEQTAMKARENPRFGASEDAKQQARAKLEEIKQRINILKKLFGANPKEMARALAQVFKELKAAVKAYKDATGEELGMSAQAAAGAMPQTDPNADGTDKTADDSAEAEASDQADPAQQTGDDSGQAERAAMAAAGGTSLYDAVTTKIREGLGEDGLDFIKQVRGLAKDLKDLLESARTQYLAKARDKETDKVFEDADKTLGSLKEDLANMERDLRQQVPTLGLRLSVAA